MQNVQQKNIDDQNTHNEIQRIVLQSDIHIKFRSIVALESNNVVGYQPYPIGPAGSELERTEDLLAAAQRYELNDELEYAVLVTALGLQHELPEEHFLSISIGSNLFLSKLFREVANLCQHIAHHIVFELTENKPFVELAFMEKRIKEIQEAGYRIALNNTKMDESNDERVKKLQPSIIKLGFPFIERITANKGKAARFISYINDLQAQKVTFLVEGVEKPSQTSLLLDLGITLGQGHFFQTVDGDNFRFIATESSGTPT